MRFPWRRRHRSRAASDILRNEDNGAPWAFVEGSISVTASIIMADAVARCDRCGGWPVIGYFKRLTEQEDGVLIAGMALLFPTALVIYLGGKMVFSAYKEYKRWRDVALIEAREEGMEKGRQEGRDEGRQEGREEGREAERTRIKRGLTERGISLDPEIAKFLFDEPDSRS